MSKWIDGCRRLKRQFEIATRDLQISSNQIGLNCLDQDEKEVDTNDDYDGITTQLSQVQAMVKRVTASTDRDTVVRVHENISSLRQKISTTLVNLFEREKSTQNSLEILMINSETGAVTDELTKNSSNKYETLSYQELLSRFGKTGGWTARAHHLFIKYRMDPDRVKSQLLISDEEFQEHDRWYRCFIKAESDHNESLRLWRINRQQQLQQLQETETSSGIIESQNVEDEEHKAREEMKRAEVKEALRVWKLQKKAEAERELMKVEREKEEKLKRETEEREKKRVELKQQLKLKQEEKEQQRQEEKGKVNGVIVDTRAMLERTKKEIERIGVRVKLRAEDNRKRAMALQRQQERMRKPIMARVEAKQIISRLFQDTESSSSKKAESDVITSRVKGSQVDPQAFFKPGRGSVGLAALPRKQIPSWRRS